MIESLNHSEQATVLDQLHTATTESSEVTIDATGMLDAIHTSSNSSTTDAALMNAAKAPSLEMAEPGKSRVNVNLQGKFLLNSEDQQRKTMDELPSLLLPSADNIENLKNHASSHFKRMLRDHNIPLAPKSISFDRAGEIELPADYSYADELHLALNQNEETPRELSTVIVLSSHYIEMQTRTPFVEAMNNATSKEEIEHVIAQYKHLLQDDNNSINTVLEFSPEGELSVTANGKAVTFV